IGQVTVGPGALPGSLRVLLDIDPSLADRDVRLIFRFRAGSDGGQLGGSVTVDDVSYNLPPTATLTNDGPADQGHTATVSFTEIDDPSSLPGQIRYSYDFGNDGSFEITDSSQPSAVVPAAYLAEGPGNLEVRGRIANDGGEYETTTTIHINNVAP